MPSEVLFQDAYKAKYKVTPVSQSNNEFIDDFNKIHVRLTKDEVDYHDFFDNCMVTVNGFYHLIDTDGQNGLLVLDAMKSLNLSKQNQIGITNWRQLGGVKRYKFNDNWLNTYADDDLEVGTVRIQLPTEINITNKTVMFCIGGYLRFIDNVSIVQTGTKIFKLNFNNMPFLDMYYESKKYIDLASLPLEHTIFNNEQISLSQLKSQANLRAYLALSQSFLVVIDTPVILKEKHHIKKTGLPGMYINYSEPKYPLVVGQGRHAEYWSRKEDGQYSVTIHDNIVDKRIYDTVLKNSLETTDGSVRPEAPGDFADAYLLKIYKN